MRVSSFSRLSSLSLSLVSILFLGVLIWGNQQLDARQAQQDNFQSIKQQVQVDVVTTLTQYLQSGDTLLLSQASELIQALITQLEQTQLADAGPLLKALTLMQQKVDSDYRAIGKLSGNSQALVLNAERSFANEISSLLDYAIAGIATGNPDGQAFVARANDLMLQLTALIHQREQLEAQPQAEENMDAIRSQLQRMQTTVNALEDLPLLGVMEPMPDQSMLLVKREPKDQASGIISELSSLSNRYPREISNTLRLVAARQQAYNTLREDIAQLQSQALQTEALLSAAYAHTLTQLKTAVVALVLILVAFSLVNYVLLKRMVNQPLNRLRNAMNRLVSEGQLEPLPDDKKRSEMSEIARSFNRLLSINAQEAEQKRQQMAVVNDALSSIAQQINLIAHTTVENSDKAQDGRQQLTQLMAVSHELDDYFKLIDNNAHETATSVEHSQQDIAQLNHASSHAQQLIADGSEAVTQLTSSVKEVTAILSMINAVSDQTNLLALNAAIEAARAGESGRGFAVVADQVRVLAKRTHDLVGDIQAILNRLMDASNALTQSYTHIQSAANEQAENVTRLSQVLVETGNKAQSSKQQVGESMTLVSTQSQHLAQADTRMNLLVVSLRDALDAMEKVQHKIDQQQTKIKQAFAS